VYSPSLPTIFAWRPSLPVLFADERGGAVVFHIDAHRVFAEDFVGYPDLTLIFLKYTTIIH
jgi:hypothetical protein